MATYSKPTTSFFVNYGQLDPSVAQRMLAPVLIAPRYALHTDLLGSVGVLSAGTYEWPGRSAETENNIIDIDSAKVVVRNPEIVIHTGVGFSKEEAALNDNQAFITLTDKSAGIGAGDKLLVGTTAVEIIAVADTSEDLKYLITVACDLSAVTESVADIASSRALTRDLVLTTVSFDRMNGITLPAELTVDEAKLTAGELYVDFKEQLIDSEFTLYSSSHASAADWAGVCDKRNPMGMMYAAASGVADGSFFYMVAVNGESEQDYIDAVNYVGQFEELYAPICYKQTIATQRAIQDMIKKYSDPKIARYKRSWFCLPEDLNKVVYARTETDERLVCEVVAGSLILADGGDFYKGRVLDGDFAVISGRKYEISDITSKTTAKLTDDSLTVAAGTAVVFERNYTKTALAKLLADYAHSINSERINFVVGDSISFNGEVVDTIYACAALAAQRCALPPHAPMNDMELPGFTVGTKNGWSDVEYELMNAGGCWVLYRDIDGRTLTYHQVTTLTDGTIAEDDSVVSNGDSIVRTLRKSVAYLCGGKGNATQALLDEIRISLSAAFKQIESESYPAIYGPRITEWRIDKLYIPEGNKRSVMCESGVGLPQPTQDSKFIFNLF